MTDEIIKELIERLHLEIEEIPRVLARMDDGWAWARSSPLATSITNLS